MKHISKVTSTVMFVLLTGMLLVVSFIFYSKFLQYNRSVEWILVSNEIKNEIFEVRSNLKDIQFEQRGFILTGDTLYMHAVLRAEDRIKQVFEVLDSLLIENPTQQENLKKLKTLSEESHLLLTEKINVLNKQYPNSLKNAAVLKHKNIMNEALKQIVLMLEIEDKLLTERTLYKNEHAVFSPIFLLVLSVLSIFTISFFFFRLQQESSLRISITERNTLLQEFSEKIEASEKRFRTLSESIPHMIWTACADGHKNYYNKYFLDYTGLSFEELINEGIHKIIFPADLEEDIRLWNRSLETGEDFKMEKRFRHHDGSYKWHISHGIAQRDAHGNLIGWIGSSTEIEEHKKFTEELEIKVRERTERLQLQNITFELAEGIAKFGSYTWNAAKGHLTYSNNLFRILDCEPQEFEPTYEKFLSFIHPDDLDQVISNGEKTMQTGELVETPYRIVSKKGNIKHLRSSGRFFGEGEDRMLIGTVQDITSDTESSRELIAKNIELENLNTELSSFSYIASHDLQEPLRKIQGFSKRIIDKDGDKLSDTTKDYFKRIYGAAQRMQNLIESLLSFSRTNSTEIVFLDTDLNIILNEVKGLLQETIKEKEAIVTSDVLPIVQAVPEQMQQLFLNLIGNALKYAKNNEVTRITITANKVDSSEFENGGKLKGDYWKISVSDNGIGFEQQYENKIFELFQRLHGKTEYEGTGIGLSICKKITLAHKGFISATGELGVGATFTIYLPVNNQS